MTHEITIDRMAASRWAPVAAAALALAASGVFTLAIYPAVSDPVHAVLDPDQYGELGRGLLEHGTLSYAPDDTPTVSRGPVYPAFVAGALAISGGWYPHAVQLAQCVLLAVTAWLTFRIAEELWDRRAGLIAGFVCAVHPLLIWYTPRIWIESAAIALTAGLILAAVRAVRGGGAARGALTGLLVGVCALSKATFLPYVAILPAVLLAAGSRKPWRSAVACLAVALATIAPWTARNAAVTGRFIPVHTLAGMNFQIGDGMIAHYSEAPWSFAELWDAGSPRRERLIAGIDPELPLWQREVRRNDIYLTDSLDRYARDPLFVARKAGINAYLFWILGETPTKTLVIAAMQIPLVAVFVPVAVGAIRRRGWASGPAVVCLMVVVYWLIHLVVVACARYSVVLVAPMVAVAAGLLRRDAACDEGSAP